MQPHGVIEKMCGGGLTKLYMGTLKTQTEFNWFIVQV